MKPIISHGLISLLLLPTLILTSPTPSFELPTCGAILCLPNGEFKGCKPSQLTCLCRLGLPDTQEFVRATKPCLDREKKAQRFCTAGALEQYQRLLDDLVERLEGGFRCGARV
ncbi:hypothetical protein P154DRAFT_527707 [Amniculicola lignicola CBS 123094]|uniref:Extracellular membrane protein CFEM domain-containing protein n=1 Tax=Amniculicola lignicola CBS 123094 TaxID=1392246 RepID=A0A6A5VX11_9PLEO|nr:hypothetical protein P154DRAFT_527707 [Amniculicola lignicola CBS 123094]